MFIESIHVKNFKSFKDSGKIVFSKPNGNKGSGLNIFVGANNSGKTNIIEAALFVLSGKYLSFIRKGDQGVWRDGREREIQLSFTGNLKNVIEKSPLTEYQKNKLINAIAKNDNTLTVKRDSENMISIKRMKVKNKFSSKSEIITNIFHRDSYEDQEKRKPLIDFEFLRSFEDKEKIKQILSKMFLSKVDEKKLAEQIYQTINNGNPIDRFTKSILVDLKKYFHSKSNIKLGFSKVDFLFKELNIKFNDDSTSVQGEGLQRLLLFSSILAFLNQRNSNKKPLVLFIDEPETFLHPQLQKKLFDSLKEISSKAQVFISTHSPYFVSPDLIQNVYCFKNEDINIGTQVFYDKEKKLNLKEDRNFFFHHRDLFFTDTAIFVEGAEDVERYKKFCEKNNLINIPEHFFMLHSCVNTFYFEQICNIFNIKKFFAITDVDFLSRKWVAQTEMQKLHGKDIPDKNWFIKNFSKFKKIFNLKNKELNPRGIFIISKPDIKKMIKEDGETLKTNKVELLDIFSKISKAISS